MANLKVRALPRYPVSVLGSNGIDASVSNGIMTIAPNWDDLASVSSLDNPENKELWVHDPDTNTYNRVTLEAVIDATSRRGGFLTPASTPNGSDDTDALQDWAADTNTYWKHLPAGNWKINSDLSFPNGTLLTGVPGKSILTAVGGGTFTDAVVKSVGSLNALPALNGNVTNGAVQMTFASTPTIGADDIILMVSTVDYSWSAWRSDYRKGEMATVTKVSGNTVTLANPLRDSYLSASTNLYRIPYAEFAMDGVSVVAPGSNEIPAILSRYLTHTRMNRVEAYGSDYANIMVDRTYGFRGESIRSVLLKDVLAGLEYGIVVSNSQDVKIVNSYLQAARHGIAVGGADVTGSIPSRDIYVQNSTLLGSGNASGASAVAGCDCSHGNTQNVWYIGNFIGNGVNLGGRDCHIINNRIVGNDNLNNGSMVNFGEPVGGLYEISGNHFFTNFDPQTSSFGVLDLGSSGNFGAEVSEETTVVLKNNSVYAPNATCPIIKARNIAATVPLSVIVDGLYAYAPDSDIALYIDEASSGTASKSISVRGVSGTFAAGAVQISTAGNIIDSGTTVINEPGIKAGAVPNADVYNPDTNEIALSTNGVQRLHIDSSGNPSVTVPWPFTSGGTGLSSMQQGSMIYASALNTTAELAKNTTATRYIANTGTSNNPQWDQIALTTGVSGTLPAGNGGTGIASYAVGDILYASAGTTLSKLADVATGSALISGGVTTAPAWGKIGLTTHVTGTLGPTNGGTGFATYTQGDILYSDASNSLAKLGKDTNATRYLSNTGSSNNPAWAQVSLTTGVSGQLPFANIANVAGLSVFGVPGTSSGTGASITGTAGQVLSVNSGGTTLGFGTIDLTSANTVAGTAWSASSPTQGAGISSSAGSITTASGTIGYQRIGKTARISGTISVSNNGTGSGQLYITLPYTANRDAVFVARNSTSQKMCAGIIAGTNTILAITDYTGAYPVTSGDTIVFTGVLETT